MAVEPMTCAEETGSEEGRIALGACVPFDVIHEPGAYVCNWSGHLLRVRADALERAHDVPVNLVGREPLLVTKISSNPQIAVNQARSIAGQLSVAVNF